MSQLRFSQKINPENRKVIAGSVYLLSVYDKGQKENISEKELDTLLKLAGLCNI